MAPKTKAEKKQKPKQLRITYVHSSIGNSERHKATIRVLGLHRLHQSVIHPDSPSLRGMLAKVNHLVQIEEV